MLQQVRCINCGASLEYGTNNYESVAKCSYCGTEHHIDRLGKVEEYKVKIQIMGAIREFYINEMKMTNMFPMETCRNIDGRLIIINDCMATKKMEIKLVEM